jgi:hypothetical protein
MKLVLDSKSYIEKQEVFAGELVARISEHLEKAGIAEPLLKELTGNIAFEVACMVDDTAGLEFDGVKANPYLTFLSEKNYSEILHLGGNSYCHELIHGILNAMFPTDETNT